MRRMNLQQKWSKTELLPRQRKMEVLRLLSRPAATATQDIKTEEGESVNGEGMGEASSQSDTGNSIPMINLPDDIKNEDVKPVSFDEVLRSAPTVNRPFSFLR